MNIVDLDKLCERFWDGNFMEIHKDDIPSIPSAFEGKTNGEVIQSVFGVMVLTVKDGKVWVERIFFPFDEVWWNAPYQKGGE